MTGIKSRRLRHRVVIERLTDVQDPITGEMTQSWSIYDQRWAEYVANSVSQFIAASATQSEVKGRFALRADDGIVPSMRIIHRGKRYEILGVMPDPDSGLEFITCAVSEGVVVV